MSAQSRTLLVCHDRQVIDAILTAAGPDWRITVCEDAREGSARLTRESFTVALAHVGLGESEQEVLSLLRAMTTARRTCATLVLAEHLTEEQIANLYRVGVADILNLPADLARLVPVLKGIATLASREPSAEAPMPRSSIESQAFDGIPAEMETLTAQLRRVAPQETTVLLTGETGTGKTRLARLVHEMSPRRNEPFLVVDCGSLSATLIESDLFGHAKGAFTGADRERQGKLAAAGRGTLLLDEINSLPLPLQAKLLRAVDERAFEPVGSDRTQTVRARLIAASNVPLEQEVSAGRFRSDLFYRLDVVGFYLPPLRERRDRILPLADSFLRELIAECGRPDRLSFSPATTALLEGYEWPGNVRELRNAVRRCVALSAGPLIEPEDLPEVIRNRAERVVQPAPPQVQPAQLPEGDASAPTLAASRQEMEIRRILEALRKHNGNRLRAAADLGISRVGLYKKLRRYGLQTPRYGKRKPEEE